MTVCAFPDYGGLKWVEGLEFQGGDGKQRRAKCGGGGGANRQTNAHFPSSFAHFKGVNIYTKLGPV